MTSRLALPAAALLSLAAIACQSSSEDTSHSAEAAWSYSGDRGPANWGDLDPAYALAKSGLRQSPIEISRADIAAAAEGSEPIEVDYHDTDVDVINNGHTVEDNYHDGGHLRVGDHEYALAQFHFHSPSEHTIDGEHSVMEMHLVHRDADGHLAVIAVMIEEGARNAEFALMSECLPEEPGRADRRQGVLVNASRLLPSDLASYRYSGSLTTPPCSEDVAWFILEQPIEASRSQVERFREVYFGNNRPTQPLYERSVTLVE